MNIVNNHFSQLTVRRPPPPFREVYMDPLPLHKALKVWVTHIINPHLFYVRLSRYTHYLKVIEERGDPFPPGRPVRTGDEVTYKSKKLDKFIRGRVVSVSHCRYKINAIDYGFDEVAISKVYRRRIMDIARVPALAVKCKLLMCYPVNPGDWDEEAIEAMRFYVNEEWAYMTAKSYSKDMYEVELRNTLPDDLATVMALTGYSQLGGATHPPGAGGWRDDGAVAGPSAGPRAGPSAEPRAGPSAGPSAEPRAGPSAGPSAGPGAAGGAFALDLEDQEIFRFKTLQVGDKKRVRMMSGKSWHDFFVADLNDYDSYIREKNNFTYAAKKSPMLQADEIHVGLPIAYYSSDKGKEERAFIKRYYPECNLAVVQAVDTGAEEKSALINIKRMPARFFGRTAAAIYCRITSRSNKCSRNWLITGAIFTITVLEQGDELKKPYVVSISS